MTGGSRGLGLALAREFGRRGARVAICARDAATLERARHDLTRRGVHVVSLAEDLTDPARVRAAVDAVRERLGHIDVPVNNARTIQVGPMEMMTLEDYEEAMRTNFWAAGSDARMPPATPASPRSHERGSPCSASAPPVGTTQTV